MTQMDTIKIGISRCLLGDKVRYDGGHKQDRYLTDTLGKYCEWVAVCPEVEYGLPVPREAMRLVGTAEEPKLVTVRTQVNHTAGMKAWAEDCLDGLAKERLAGFIFKSKSPSSGMQGVKVYSSHGMPSRRGAGIFANAFMRRFPVIPVEDEGRLNDPTIRENFIERVFVFKRWQDTIERGGSAGNLVEFHTDHKLLILAHSPRHYTILGRYVAGSKGYRGRLDDIYGNTLMEGLRLVATPKKNGNVLLHTMGYFKKRLSGDEKQELLQVIGHYQEGLIPLIVPITLLSHYVRRYDVPYLKRQYYLNPHPLELMLRNHV
jgi:uncharacterized protein YbgA (DUF1722 family)/uncharacterized protein YbbK (DUF523 family)